MEIGLGFNEAVDRSAKCKKCPLLNGLQADYMRASFAADNIIDALMSGMSRDDVAARMRTLGFPDEVIDGLTAEDAEDLVNAGKETLSHVDRGRDQCIRMGKQAANACAGALTMRARRDGKEVKVTVCMSDEVETVLADMKFDPAVIERRVAD